MTATLDERVTNSIIKPGDPVNVRLDRHKLPVGPKAIDDWVIFTPNPDDCGLYLVGPHNSGKTWLGHFAALEIAANKTDIGYWTEMRYKKDTERLRWYERTVSNMGRQDVAAWEEYVNFEAAYVTLTMMPVLVFDEMYYWDLLDFQRQEIDVMLRTRLESDMTTIICAKEMPQGESPLLSAVDKHCVIVPLEALS